jgi:hypothetical protein
MVGNQGLNSAACHYVLSDLVHCHHLLLSHRQETTFEPSWPSTCLLGGGGKTRFVNKGNNTQLSIFIILQVIYMVHKHLWGLAVLNSPTPNGSLLILTMAETVTACSLACVFEHYHGCYCSGPHPGWWFRSSGHCSSFPHSLFHPCWPARLASGPVLGLAGLLTSLALQIVQSMPPCNVTN